MKALQRFASRNIQEDISKITYKGQPESHRRFTTGFEENFDSLPIIRNNEDKIGLLLTQSVMRDVSDKVIARQKDIITDNLPEEGKFARVIIAMESPQLLSLDCTSTYKEGVELVVALWGKGMSSPVHGHSAGYMHEELLTGKLKVNTYRIVDKENKVVRRLVTNIVEKEQEIFVSKYTESNGAENKRNVLIHNFEALETSASLHYLPEHTRDGRDKTWLVYPNVSKVAI